MKKLAMVLGATFLIISIVAANLWRELRTQNEQNSQMAMRVAAVESAQLAQVAMSRPPEPATPPPAADSALSMAVQTAPADTAAPAAREQPARRDTNSLIAGLQQSMDTPEGREFARTMMRMMLAQEFPDLAKEMNLSPEEAEKLLDLLAARRVDLGTGLQAGRSTRDPAAREEMSRALADRERAFEAELVAILGDNYPKWAEYQRSAADRQREGYARQQVEQLRNAVSSSSNPLGDAQFQLLNTALAEEQRRIDQDSRGLTTQQQLQRLTEDNRRLAEVAAAHLNSGQLDGYRRYLQQRTSTMRAMVGVMGGEQGTATTSGAAD